MQSNPGKTIGIAIVLMGSVGLISQLIKIQSTSEISYAKIFLSLIITAYGVIKIRSSSRGKS